MRVLFTPCDVESKVLIRPVYRKACIVFTKALGFGNWSMSLMVKLCCQDGMGRKNHSDNLDLKVRKAEMLEYTQSLGDEPARSLI